MKNYLMILTLIIVIGIIGGVGYLKMFKPSSSMVSKPTASIPSTGQVKEFTVTAKQFQYTPGVITVKQGDRGRLKITSTDVAHGFALPDFNVNLKLPLNQEVVAEFVADKKGEFEFHCNVPCGLGHKEMIGKIIVT